MVPLVLAGLNVFAAYENVRFHQLEHSVAREWTKAFSINHAEVLAEDAIFEQCKWGTEVTQAARDCVLRVAPLLNDWQVARRGAQVLSFWLQGHPTDLQAREQALRLMDHAWSSWFRDYQPAYARARDAEDAAIQNSYLYALTRVFRYDPGVITYQLLANLDTAIVSPEEANRELKRREAHPGQRIF
jgi:hypothetical protein